LARGASPAGMLKPVEARVARISGSLKKMCRDSRTTKKRPLVGRGAICRRKSRPAVALRLVLGWRGFALHDHLCLVLWRNRFKTMSFAALLKLTIRKLGALENKVFPSALAFLARQFSVFFDDVPFSVARDTNHFPLLALRVDSEQQAFQNLNLRLHSIQQVLFQPH
jgi:hypothetical protein